MNISMVGIDYNKAKVEDREKFSLTITHSIELANQVKKKYKNLGCIILSTCNRTELWFSGLGDYSPMSIFLKEKDLWDSNYHSFFVERFEEDAVHYLMELACGLHSQIFGEDQILTQIKTALSIAREEGLSDSVLETLFREAITAAKKVKTTTMLTEKNQSVPESAVALLIKKIGCLEGKRCLVIGNGEMGRLTVEQLIKQNAIVSMTLRQYKKGRAIIPEGCNIISYEERLKHLKNQDIVVSATLSPHFTLRVEDVRTQLMGKQYIFVDLAVPRDIDPNIGKLDQVELYDMDELGIKTSCDEKELKKAKRILKKYEEQFINWYYFRPWVPTIQGISSVTAELTNGKLEKVYKHLDLEGEEKKRLQKNIQIASEKAVAKLIYGLREHLNKEQWGDCLTALNKAAEDCHHSEL